MKIPKVWHPILRWQATFIVSTVYLGYGIMSLYIHEKQNDIWATSTMVILGLLTILFNSGRLIRMEKAENTLESKAIIIFNILSFSVRFFILKSYRGLLLPNGLATIAVMSKNTAHSKGSPFWAMLPIVSIAFHFAFLGAYELWELGMDHFMHVIYEIYPLFSTVIIFGLFIVFGNVQLSSECDQLQETSERLQVALDAKNNFVSHISHEFRCPILSSMGSIELIKETNLTKEQREHIETIESAESILLTLIEDILLFVKTEHESKNTSIDNSCMQPFNLEKCIHTVQGIMKVYANKFNVEVKAFIEIVEKSSLFVKVNQARLQQVLINLLTNAIKASRPGTSVELHCNLIPPPLLSVNPNSTKIDSPSSPAAGSISWFEFKVVDYGVGIPASKKDYIFHPFGQLHNLNESIFPGSGLGLSTVKNIVSSMGGSIRLDSEEGKGSTFTITIPLMVLKNSSDTLTQENNDYITQIDTSIKRQINIQSNYIDQFQKAEQFTNKMEDKPLGETSIIIAEVLTKLMHSLGYNVDVVFDGKQLVESIDPKRHKLVITDQNMPVMTGLTAAREIRRKYRDIKIIMLTADALANSELYSSSVDALICKPCTRQDLKNNIEMVLHKD